MIFLMKTAVSNLKPCSFMLMQYITKQLMNKKLKNILVKICA